MPHQIKAINQLESGNILCAGVGTGKSITAIGFYYIHICGGCIWGDGNLGPLLRPKDLYIITTARKRDTKEWEKECERFALEKEENVKITIDSWNNLHKYTGVKDAFFILDEQRISGSGAWVREFYKIARVNEWILLSATPGDSWMDYIPVFVANGFYKNRTQFLARHAVYNRFSKYPKVDRWLEAGHLERLRRHITVSMIYEKKTVPHWENVVVKYDWRKYDQVVLKRWNIYENRAIKNISEACYLMRKVVNFDECRARKLFWIVLSDHPKAIIFYNYDYEVDLIKKTFEEMLKLESIKDEDRELAVAEWNGHKHEPIPKTNKWVYLVQYNAGCEGWNCVETDTIIFYSQNYSYKMMTQAAGRIDRLNTPFVDLYYYTFKSDAPIDKAITRALNNKKNFNAKNFIQEHIGWKDMEDD